MVMEYIVGTKGLTKVFKKEKAVDELDLQIAKGEIYGFLGPNGAGKTTTIRLLLGLMKPTAGKIRIFQKELAKERIEILKKVGSLVENPSYYPHLTAYENLEVMRKILGIPKTRIDEVLEIVRLTDVRHKKVKGFSLGMKQRLGIAMALLNEPELLILDEPTNGLDPSGIIEIRELLKRLPKERGMTIFVSSHLLSEIEQIATTVGIIKKGKLIFQGSIESLRKVSQPRISLRVDDSKKAMRILLERDIQPHNEKDRLFFAKCSDDKVGEIVRVLVENGIALYRVEEEKRSLEDIFLQITGGAHGK